MTTPACNRYDVVLCSRVAGDRADASHETQRVRRQAEALADELRSRGVRVFDDDELPPGLPWKEYFEQAIESAPVAVFLVGTKELGRWDRLQEAALTSQYSERDLRLITVLLDGGPDADDLPTFLRQFPKVEYRDDRESEAVRLLTWGILHGSIADDTWGLARKDHSPEGNLLNGVLQITDGFLGGSLGERPHLPLTRHRVASVGQASGEPLPADADLLELARQGSALLLLGGPGAGKSTLLYRLARDAADRARVFPFTLLPVVLELSTWDGSGRGEPADRLRDWIVRQMKTRFRVDKQQARRWEESKQLMLFLDGFDQVERRWRGDCLRAIAGYGSVPLVLASRGPELQAAMADTGTDLEVWTKVVLQPLDRDQVLHWLGSGAEENDDLQLIRQAAESDPRLRELARTPLWLQLMTHNASAIRKLAATSESSATGATDLESQILDLAIERGLARVENDPQDVVKANLREKRHLAWLAHALAERGREEFFLEDLQPGWLNSAVARGIYFATSRSAAGLLLGLAFVFYPADDPALPVVVGFVAGLFAACVAALRFRAPGPSEIRTHTIYWRIPRNWKGPLAFAVLALGVGGVWMWCDLVTTIVVTVLAFVASVFGLYFWGTHRRRIDPHRGLVPESALRETRDAALRVFLMTLVLTLATAGAFYLYYWLNDATPSFIDHFGAALLVALPLMIGATLFFGGYSLIRHHILRWILSFQELLPLRAVHRLDHAARSTILKKVGRGYSFHHQIVRDHLASQHPIDPPAEPDWSEPR